MLCYRTMTHPANATRRDRRDRRDPL